MVAQKDSTFEEPVLKKGVELSHSELDYFSGLPEVWEDLSIDEREAHIIDMSRGRCPIMGEPKAGEELVVVRIQPKKLLEAEAIDSPWMYMPILYSPKKDRDITQFIGPKAIGSGWLVAHWDVLDEEKGFEVLDNERRSISHADLDFYTRASSTAAQSAEEWHNKTCEAYSRMLKAMYDFTAYMSAADDNIMPLGFEKPKDWMNAVGIKFTGDTKVKKVFDYPFEFANLWKGDDHISPFTLSAIIGLIPEEDMLEWLPRIKEKAAFRPLLGGASDSDINGLIAEIKEAFPKESKPKHYLVFPGKVEYTELEHTDTLPQDQSGLSVTVVEGKLSWKGKMSTERLGLPFSEK